MTIPAHPLAILERNVAVQLQASKDIFTIVLDLTNIADQFSGDAQATLEQIMRRLLTVGESLSREAGSAGEDMWHLITPANTGRSSTQSQGKIADGATPFSRP